MRRSDMEYGPVVAWLYGWVIDPLLYPLRTQVVRLCRELGAGEILDIASGTGVQCRLLGRAGIRATGLELSEAMLAVAARHGGHNVRYVQGTACELPFSDGSFDATLLSLALHEHDEPQRALILAEALRVARRGGHVLVADYAIPRASAFHPVWQVIRLVEHLGGGEHRAGFGDFVLRGGVEGFLERHGLEASLSVRSHWGAVGIAAAPVAADRTSR